MELNLEKIKQLRINNNLSMEDMAIYLGYRTATGYYYAESGRCKFKPNHIPLIAIKFNIGMNELYSDNNFAETANTELGGKHESIRSSHHS
ncbi:MAG TPA: helix-turn-helix transcriptional regulator [Bacillota bacterium]|nr:helix-turn-helix transcriptional regulator [Bacillota bacterium]